MPCVIGLDIGTTSTIGVLLRLPDEVLAVASRPVALHSPYPGWAEEEPAQWWDNVCSLTRDLLRQGGVQANEVAAIGVAGMLPAVILLDASGTLIRPSIQQSDGRCGEEVAAMRAEWPEDDFLRRAGNGINQQLVGAKLRWVERHEPENFTRIATVFGSYDYVNWRLTGLRAIEQNWALEGGFIDLATHQVADDFVRFAHCPKEALPPLIRSHAILGPVTAEAARETGLSPGTLIVGGAADMIASALGAGVTNPGDILLKFGGAIDVVIAADRFTPDPRMFLDYHLAPGLFMPNGCMATGGSGLNWFARTFAGGEQAAAAVAGLTLHQHLDRLAADRPPGAEGLAVLPYFLGEKTPIHDPAARGAFCGLTLAHDTGHLWRALLEAYAYAIRHHVEVLNEMGHATTRFLVSDGGSASRVWMQIVADVLQTPLQGLTGHLGSCVGAAWTAAMGAKLVEDWGGAARFVELGDIIEPDPANTSVYARGYGAYRDLYRRLASGPVQQ